MDVTIREVDDVVYKVFKTKVTATGQTIGAAFNQLMQQFLKHNEKKRMDRTENPFLEWMDVPIDWGVKTDSSKIKRQYYSGEFK